MNARKCNYCASEIASQAILCPVCRNYQAAWRNNLLFAAGLTGFVALVGSAFIFTAHQIVDIYKQAVWKDNLNVLEFRAGRMPHLRIVLSNGGDGPVFASAVVVTWQGGNYAMPLNKLVPVNGIETIDNPEVPNATPRPFITNYTGGATAAMFKKSDMFSNEEKQCIVAMVFDTKNYDLERMKEYYAKSDGRLALGDVGASIVFFQCPQWGENPKGCSGGGRLY